MEEKEAAVMTMKQIIAAVEKLPVEQQEKLLSSLKDKDWARSANRLLHADVQENAQAFLDQLSVGGMFEFLSDLPDGFEALSQKWTKRVKILSEMQDPKSEEKHNFTTEEIEHNLESTYQRLQMQLIELRQATAIAVATEKQLVAEMERNSTQAETWQNRADMARQEGSEDLAEQALQRRQLYITASEEIRKQLNSQRTATILLREQLTNAEGLVANAYRRKQILVARNRVATAMSIFHELMIDFSDDHLDAYTASAPHASDSPTSEVVSKTVVTLERAMSTIVRLEEKIQKLEEKIETLQSHQTNAES